MKSCKASLLVSSFIYSKIQRINDTSDDAVSKKVVLSFTAFIYSMRYGGILLVSSFIFFFSIHFYYLIKDQTQTEKIQTGYPWTQKHKPRAQRKGNKSKAQQQTTQTQTKTTR